MIREVKEKWEGERGIEIKLVATLYTPVPLRDSHLAKVAVTLDISPSCMRTNLNYSVKTPVILIGFSPGSILIRSETSP